MTFNLPRNSTLFHVSINMLEILLGREFRQFAIVGGVGFCVDGGLLSILIYNGWNIIPARSCSFLLAVSTTWLLNRLWTFNSSKNMGVHREFIYYYGTQIIGALINLSIFFTVINLYPSFRNTPLIPFAFGSATALIFNYLISKIFIFRSH